MRIRWVWAACGALSLGCGSHDDTGLFGTRPTGACSSAPCVGANACAGHQECGSDGTLGACRCDSAEASGGQANATDAAGTGEINRPATGGTPGSGGASGGGGGAAIDSGSPGKDPPAPAPCPAGQYKGKLSGTYVSGFSRADVGATIDFSVDSSGPVTGSYKGPNGAAATLSGTLDCSTGELSVNIQSGSYSLSPLPGTASFDGTISGRYSRDSSAFVDGTWTIEEPGSSLNGGTGTWVQQ